MSAVFELDKVRVRSSFAAASNTYDGLAALQRSAGSTLLNQFADTAVSGKVLDLGCGTGFLTGNLLNFPRCQKITALDVALPMLKKTRDKFFPEANLNYLCADAESLPFKENSFDWAFSNLALQWCGNLGEVFNEIERILKPEGKLVFSTFGPQTLKELKHAWSQVDDYTHVNQFYSEYQIIEFMKKAGLQKIQAKRQRYISNYRNVIELMRELKGIGAHNATIGRNRGLTGKRKLQSMAAAYEQFRKGGVLSATFEIIYLVADADS